ncbi:SDR family oxidoreductase [uncultured Vagococcus sp.]|uniref:SDR family NAD(P)-dependent oxidoreductase n=1 Tax=uncultured Vagococcus sp. TaxID=189676 RepID=UPI0028D571CD|nr:SDR family oxidoreductase [uncultured Vagococcus sp.]
MFLPKVDLTGKVVVITGGSAGLGEQIAYEAAKRNAIVVVCARRINLIGKVREACTLLSNFEAHSFQLDIGNPDNVEEVYEKITEDVGAVDILVNCAGFGLFRNFTDFDLSVAEEMFRVNVLGLMYMTQKIAIDMAERQTGHIVNIASQAAKMATVKSTIYSATKFAVLGFSNALRLELKPLGVKVTTVNPGPIATNFFDIADESGDYLANVNWLVLQPQPLAEKIVNSFNTNRREINAPGILEVASKAYLLFPRIGDYFAGNMFNTK